MPLCMAFNFLSQLLQMRNRLKNWLIFRHMSCLNLGGFADKWFNAPSLESKK